MMWYVGLDMASAFLEILVGEELTTFVRTVIELGVRDREDDEFTAVHGLIQAIHIHRSR